jgi:Rhodopirellula transposase DDE domain
VTLPAWQHTSTSAGTDVQVSRGSGGCGRPDNARDVGFVNVGITNETAEFAVGSIRAWWGAAWPRALPPGHGTADHRRLRRGNGNRTRLWKTELQRLADPTGLAISVCHFPRGTSRWNQTEHCLFSFIAKNWRGRPLISHQVIINSIAPTTTRSGLEVYARLDEREYPNQIEVSDAELAAVNIEPHNFHPEWTYDIRPKPQAIA